MIRRMISVSAAVFLIAVSAWAQSYAIKNAKIVTVSGPVIPNGNIVIQNGRITAVGANISIPSGATTIDAKGLTAYPGMIDSFTEMGLTEISRVAATVDVRELGDLNPQMKASDAINPNSEHIAVTRTNGVTTVVSKPSGGLIAGQAAVINLNGWVTQDMMVKDSAALIVNFPPEIDLPANVAPRLRQELEEQRKKRIELLRRTMRDAQSFLKLVDARSDEDTSLMLKALVPALRGEMPVMITADTAQEIREALQFAEDFKLKAILVGGAEAWKTVDLLKSKNTPVLLGSVMDLPRKDEYPYDANYATAAALSNAGVKFAFTTSGKFGARDLPFIAGMAAAFGLSKEEALKAVTLYPAQILNIDKQVGSIAEGMQANIILTDGDPLEPITKVKHLFIGGKPVELKNKQIELYEKYSQRP